MPITKYAKQLIDNLAKETGYPTGFAAAYAVNVVSKEDNVKSVISKIELGQGDAGVVYLTDAAASTKVSRARRGKFGMSDLEFGIGHLEFEIQLLGCGSLKSRSTCAKRVSMSSRCF